MAVSESFSFRGMLRRHRIAAGLSQEELAEKAGLSTRAISDLERGAKTRPRPHTARQLADALQLHASDRLAFLEAAHGIAPGSPPGESADVCPPRARQPQPLVTGGFLGSLPAERLVARTEEMDRILSSVDAVTRGQGQLVALGGEPGVGKTRLAQEVTVVVRDRGFLLGTGRCYEPQQDVPYYPFLDLLAALYGAAPSAIQDQSSHLWPYLAPLLPDELGPGPLSSSEDPDYRWRLVRAVTGFVTSIADMSPVALLLDDLHWADSASIDLLAHLTRHMHDHRVLILGTFRDDEAPFRPSLQRALHDLGREDLLQWIAVRRLGVEGTAALMAATMGKTEIPTALAQRVYGRTEGNAFFVQQVVRDLLEHGVLPERDTDWALQIMGIPKNVRVAIGYRLGRLEEQTREVLRAASTLGQSFSFDDLHAMTAWKEEGLEAALGEARMAGLVQESGVDTYTFDHVLTQQALYEDLSARQRRRLHLAAGVALEALPEREQKRRAAELAWHFRHGNDVARALAWTIRAGEQAEGVFAYQEAEHHYRLALDLAQSVADPTREAEGWEKLGQVLKTLARYDEALSALEMAAGMYGQRGDVDGEARAVASIGLIYTLRGMPNEGLARMQPVLDTLASSGQSPSLPVMYAALVRLYDGAGDHEAELAAAERAVEAASAIQDSLVLAEANVAQGNALNLYLRFDDALTALRNAVHVAERTGDLPILYRAHRFLVFTHVGRGRVTDALTAADRAVEVAERLNDPEMLSVACSTRAFASFLAGDWDTAEKAVARALSLSKQVGAWQATTFALIWRGWLGLLQGDWQEASRSLRESAEMAERSGNQFMLRLAQVALAECDVLIGRPENACRRLLSFIEEPPATEDLSTEGIRPAMIWAYLELGELRRAEQILEEHLGRPKHGDYAPARARVLWLQAMIAIRCAHWDEARSALERGLALTRSMPYPLLEGRLLTVYGQMYVDRGALREARERLVAAQTNFKRLAARPDMERVDRLLRALDADCGQ